MAPAGTPYHEQSPIADRPDGDPLRRRTPFTAEVYFVSLREFSDLRWGTAQPVVFRDSDFGMVRLRAFGAYSIASAIRNSSSSKSSARAAPTPPA